MKKITSSATIFLLIVSSLVSIFFYIPTVSADGENWCPSLTNWGYRKLVTINNNITNYQSNLTIFKNTGTFNLSNHCNDNFSDIRFVKYSDNTTLLYHWIESYTSGTSCEVWLNSSTEDKAWIYYGYSSAPDTSDGNNTFIVFDDFESYDLDENINGQNGWVTVQGDGGAYVLIKSNPAGSGQVLEIYETGSTSTHPYAYNQWGTKLPDLRVWYDVRFSSLSGVTYFPYFSEDSTWTFTARVYHTSGAYEWYDGGDYNAFSPSISISTNTWYSHKVELVTTGGDDFDIYVDGDSGHDGGVRSSPSVGVNRLSCNREDDNPYYVDTVRVGLFTTGTEPSFVFESEEAKGGWENSNPVITASSENPPNTQTDVYFSLSNFYNHFNISVTDLDDANQTMNVTWRTNETTGVWHDFDENLSVDNGTYYATNVSWIDTYNTKYWWSVNVSDGCGGWDNETFYFTTRENPITWNVDNFGGNVSITQEQISSEVNDISPYEQTSSPLTITATTGGSPGNVSLWYRWSDDNSSWNGGNCDYGNDSVDSSADDYSPTGVGTHSLFSNMQTKDGTMDTLTEGNNGTSSNYVNDSIDSNSCNVDSSNPADIGNETNFNNCQDISPDSDYMNIQENNTGVGVDSYATITTYTDERASWSHVYTDDSTYLYAIDYSDNYIYSSSNNQEDGDWLFESVSSGTYDVNVTFYTRLSESGDDGFEVFDQTDTLLDTIYPTTSWDYYSISLGSMSDNEMTELAIHVIYAKVGGQSAEIEIDYLVLNYSAEANTNYELDFEYQWTSADYDETNEYVCIEVNDHTGNDNLYVSYYNSGWVNLGTITSTGWNNFTATGLTSSTYTIRLNTTADSSDTTQDDWNIDVIKLFCYTTGSVNYGLDLEVKWTSLEYSHDVEQLCIFTGTQNAEALKVDVYYSGSWVNLISDLSASTWNNVSVTSYLTSSTLNIRFKATTETSDTSQGTWEIDFVKIYYYNTSGGTHGWNWHLYETDTGSPWSWSFNFPNGTGYYEFYSIANKTGHENESAPGSADAICNFTGSLNLQLSIPTCYPTSGVADYTTFYFNITWTDVDDDNPTDSGAYLTVNISRSGWSTNQSMSWHSGSNNTGAIYIYSTTLSAGSYTYHFWGYDGDGHYADSGDHSNPTVSSQSLSFDVTMSSASGQFDFKDWTLTLTGVGLTTEYNVSEDNQTAVIPALNISNTGNVPLNFSIYWLSSPGSGIYLKYNYSDNPPLYGVNNIATSPSKTQVITNLDISEYEEIWLYMDFVNVQAGTGSQDVRIESELYDG